MAVIVESCSMGIFHYSQQKSPNAHEFWWKSWLWETYGLNHKLNLWSKSKLPLCKWGQNSAGHQGWRQLLQWLGLPSSSAPPAHKALDVYRNMLHTSSPTALSALAATKATSWARAIQTQPAWIYFSYCTGRWMENTKPHSPAEQPHLRHL